jgi:hypothetical protein
VRLATNGVKLWLLVWVSGWLVVPLEIRGWPTYALGAALVTVTTTPVWWYDRVRVSQSHPPPPLPTPGTGAPRGGARRSKAWVHPFVFLGTVAGVDVAARLVPGFSLGGPAAERFAAASLIAAAATATQAGVYRIARRVLDRPGHAPAALSVVVSPVAVWLAAWCGGGLGLAVELEGFAATVGTALVIALAVVVTALAYAAVVAGHQPRYRRRAASMLIDYTATLAGLWLATALDAVRLEPGSVVARLVAAIVLSALFMPVAGLLGLADVAFAITGSRRAVAAVAAVDLAVAVVVLWALSWLSTATPVTLSISGFFGSLLTVLLMAGIRWARILRRIGRSAGDPWR